MNLAWFRELDEAATAACRGSEADEGRISPASCDAAAFLYNSQSECHRSDRFIIYIQHFVIWHLSDSAADEAGDSVCWIWTL